MEMWITRICRACAMGVAWAAAWMPIGLLAARLVLDPRDTLDEPWIALGTLPGFLCGLIFSSVSGVAASRRRLDELSVGGAAGWGLVTGVLAAVFGHLANVGIPRVDPQGVVRLVLVDPVVVDGSVVLFSTLSGIASALIARRDSQPGEEPILLKRP